MNQKFGDSVVLVLLRGGNPTCLPCPDRPGLHPHHQRSPWALPQTAREWAKGKDWGPDFASASCNDKMSHSAATALYD